MVEDHDRRRLRAIGWRQPSERRVCKLRVLALLVQVVKLVLECREALEGFHRARKEDARMLLPLAWWNVPLDAGHDGEVRVLRTDRTDGVQIFGGRCFEIPVAVVGDCDNLAAVLR